MKYPINVGASDKTISRLTEFYKTAYKSIISEILTATDFGVYNRKQILNQIEEILEELGVEVQSFIETEIPRFYKVGADNAVEQLKSAGFNIEVASGFNRIHKEAVNNLIDEVGVMFAESMTGVKRSAEKLLGKAVREMISFKMAEGVTKGSALREVKNMVKSVLSEYGLDSLIDKAGRSWSLDRYTEMLIRTKTVEARNRGLINRVLENGYDLVQVSDHMGECELCRPWEGRILSLTGNTKGYPTLAEAESQGLFHPNCYSKDTEVYTNNGWKLFKDVENEDKIMSLRPTDQTMEWSKFVKKIIYKFNGEMISLTSNSFDLLVTPDHYLYVGTNSHKENKKPFTKWKLLPAQEAILKNHRQLRIPRWKGKSISSPLKKLNIKQYAFLLGAYLAEGHIDKNKVIISQNEFRKDRYRKELVEMGFYENKNRFLKNEPGWAKHFKKLGKSYKKYFPSFFLQANSEILKEGLRGFILGDGSIKRKKGYDGFNISEMIYFTSSNKLAGQIGEILLKTGKYPSFKKPTKPKIIKFKNGNYLQKHTCWIIRANKSENSYYNLSPSIKKRGIQLEKIRYLDNVYCLELEKNHIMLVRRNGKVAWSGNCRHAINTLHRELAEKTKAYDIYSGKYV